MRYILIGAVSLGFLSSIIFFFIYLLLCFIQLTILPINWYLFRIIVSIFIFLGVAIGFKMDIEEL